LTILGFILFLMSLFVIRQGIRRKRVKLPRHSSTEQEPDSSNPFRAVMHHKQQDDDVQSGS
jgi:uncharacterized membrane protein